MIFRLLIILTIIPSILFSQFENDLSGGYSGRGGNTDFQYWNISYSLTSFGDISLGGTVLKDSEFLFAFEKIMQHGQELKIIIMINRLH